MKTITHNALIYMIENTLLKCDNAMILSNGLSASPESKKSFFNLICMDFASNITNAKEIYEFREVTLAECLSWSFNESAREMGISQRANSLFTVDCLKRVDNLVDADKNFKTALIRAITICEEKELSDLYEILKVNYHSVCSHINSENYKIPNSAYSVDNITSEIIAKNADLNSRLFHNETKELPSVLPIYERYLSDFGTTTVYEICEMAQDILNVLNGFRNVNRGIMIENNVLSRLLLAHLQADVITRMICANCPPGGPTQKSEQVFLEFSKGLTPVEIHCLLPIVHFYVSEPVKQRLFSTYERIQYSGE